MIAGGLLVLAGIIIGILIAETLRTRAEVRIQRLEPVPPPPPPLAQVHPHPKHKEPA